MSHGVGTINQMKSQTLAGIFCISILTLLHPVFAAPADSKSRPNVLLILTDDQGFGDAAFQGNPNLKTPNLDALAASGVRFTDFIASPTCSPTRAALMTGRHEFRSSVTHTIEGRNLLRAGVPIMADAFKKAGYRTGIFGKWHLGESSVFHPNDRGFDHSLLIGGGGVGQTPDYWGSTMFDPYLQENGEWKPFKGYMTDVFVSEAQRWIEKDKKPWFCYIPLNAPHGPHQISDEWAAPYRAMGLKEEVAKFYGMIANIDAQVGKLLESFAKNGLDRNTVVIFMGDNGSSMADFSGGLRASKACPYQGGVRVPAVFSWEGRFPAGSTVNTLAGMYDVLPTLGEICGLDLSKFPKTDGRSLLPILIAGKQPADWTDRTIPMHVARWPSGTTVDKLPFKSSSIRNQRYSLVNGKELYDLQADPGESKDISKENPEVSESLRATYLEWWDGVKGDALTLQPLFMGRPGQGPVELTLMDWQPSQTTKEPLNGGAGCSQDIVKAWISGGKAAGVDGATGGWMMHNETAGNYELEIRQHPVGVGDDTPFSEGEATLDIGGEHFAQKIAKGDVVVRMNVEIPAGDLFFEPLISGQRPSGKPQGAYFCRIAPVAAGTKK